MDQYCSAELRTAVDEWIAKEVGPLVVIGEEAVAPIELRKRLPMHECEYTLRQDQVDAVAKRVGYDDRIERMSYFLAVATLVNATTLGEQTARRDLRSELNPVPEEPVRPGHGYPGALETS